MATRKEIMLKKSRVKKKDFMRNFSIENTEDEYNE